jgi:D-alanyl-D-alanine carboxypeptidase
MTGPTWPLSAVRRVLALAMLCAAALAPALPAKAGPTLLFEPGSGAVLHYHAPFDRWHPASLTKLMTLYLVFDGIRRGEAALDTSVRFSERAAAITANTMNWPVGTEITLGEAIPILITKSANDVALAVAETLAGSEAEFVSRMNAMAGRLGMTDTDFVNPHGLHDPGQYMSARDVAILVTALIDGFPQYLPTFAEPEGTIRGEELRSHNRLLGAFEGADGIKTGYVCSAGWNIAASATRDGRRLVAIVLGGLREGHREEIAAELLEAGFSGRMQPGPLSMDALPRPAPPRDPVDMRPYLCGGAQLPLHLSYFGMESVPLPRARPAVP